VRRIRWKVDPVAADAASTMASSPTLSGTDRTQATAGLARGVFEGPSGGGSSSES
jgi:hypothetical protein